MAKAERLARLDERRAELETEYLAAFTKALEVTAAGRWGLFGHTKDRAAHAAAAPVIAKLSELGDAIDAMRDTLSLPPLALHAQFLASRGPARSDAVGEPKQAQQWLARLKQAEHP